MCFSYTGTHPKFIYNIGAQRLGPLGGSCPPANGHGPAEVKQRCQNGPTPAHPLRSPPSLLPPYRARTELQTEVPDEADTKTLGVHSQRGAHIYTRFFSPSLVTCYSYTVVLGYRSIGKPAFMVSVATDCCFPANGISVSMVTGRTRASL